MTTTHTKAQCEWARCRPWIEAAVARAPFGLETIEDVEAAIARGAYQFWPGERAACVTEIQQYPRKKVLAVVHGGGALDELVDRIEPALCTFARAAGCDLIAGIGRMGWKRVTETRGYSFGWVAMFKPMTVERPSTDKGTSR